MRKKKEPKEREYKCRYSHCRTPDTKVLASKAVKIGNIYYHPECYKEKQTIEKTLGLYSEKVDSAVVFKQLRAAINNIIFDKGVSADLVLFALQYAIKEKRSIKSPYYLHYLVKDRRIRAAYDENKKRKITPQTFNFDNVAVSETTCRMPTSNKNNGFTKILK